MQHKHFIRRLFCMQRSNPKTNVLLKELIMIVLICLKTIHPRQCEQSPDFERLTQKNFCFVAHTTRLWDRTVYNVRSFANPPTVILKYSADKQFSEGVFKNCTNWKNSYKEKI